MINYRAIIRQLSASYGRIWIVTALSVGLLAILLCIIFALKIQNLPTPDENLLTTDYDLSTYLVALDRLEQHQSPYLAGDWTTHVAYQYPVQFLALFLEPVSALVGVKGLQVVLMAVNVLGYLGGVLLLARLVHPTLDSGGRGRLLLFLSFALIEMNFLANVHLGNVASILVGLSMGALWAFVRGKPLLAGVLSAAMILIKPYWVVIPLVLVVSSDWLRCRRKLFRFGAAFGGCLVLSFVVVSLALGTAFSLAVSQEYFTFITQVNQHYNWQMIFQVYSQSVQAVIYRVFGFDGPAQVASTLVKLALLALLGVNVRRLWKAHLNLETDPFPYLALAFMSYVIVQSILPELLELTFLAIILAFFQATGDRLVQRITLPTLLVVLYVAFLANGFIPYLLLSACLVMWASHHFIGHYLEVRSGQPSEGIVPENNEAPNAQIMLHGPVGR